MHAHFYRRCGCVIEMFELYNVVEEKVHTCIMIETESHQSWVQRLGKEGPLD